MYFPFKISVLRCVISLFLLSLIFTAPSQTLASMSDGAILSGPGEGYSWSDNVGYMNWTTTNGDVHVSDSGLSGYVWDSNFGWMNLSPVHAGVTLNPETGALGGWAWSSGGGWVNFSGASIDSTGHFIGITAASSLYGSINFGCDNCSVRTDWRPRAARAGVQASASTATDNQSSGSKASVSVSLDTPVSPPLNISHNHTDATNTDVAGGLSAAVANFDQQEYLKRRPGAVERAEARTGALFDIYFFAERKNIAKSSQLVTRTTFDSFGEGPVAVSLSFSVLDASGKEFYHQEATTSVETQGLFVKRYRDLVLPDGKYHVLLRVKYRTIGEDVFTIPFIVDSSLDGAGYTELLLIEILLLLLPCLYVLYFGVINKRVELKDIEVEVELSSVKKENQNK